MAWIEGSDIGPGEKVDFSLATLTHKVLAYDVPESLSSMLQTNCSRRERVTRQDLMLYVPRSRTEIGKRRFESRAPSLYNMLPTGLRELEPRRFPRALRRYVLDGVT